MFKKVLVVEDIDAINIGVLKTLGNAFPFEIEHANDCDKAFLKIKKALQSDTPFDLLITDLSFHEAQTKAVIKSGEDLISVVRGIQPKIKVLIYSIEDRPFKITQFIDYLGAEGYVLKGRNSSRELVDAINTLGSQQRYISPQLEYSIKKTPALEIDAYDLELLKHLANGYSQQEIGEIFAKKGLSPTSLSSIEKRLNKLKDYFMARNTPHLVAIAKDMGLF
jgi:DNA-binding NarL/FixJ family response regulator